MNMMSDSRPVSELFADALNQFSKLIRSEINLARAEMTVKARQMMSGAAMLVAAAVVLIPSLVLLLMSFAQMLVEVGMRGSVAHLIAGILGLAIMGGLAWAGIQRLKSDTLVPDRTMGQLRQDAAAVKEHV